MNSAAQEIKRARDALHHIDPNLPRDKWHAIGRAAIAAGLPVDDLVEWSRLAANFKSEQDVRAAFRTIKPDGGTGPGTLFKAAKANGWIDTKSGLQRSEEVAAGPTAQLRTPADGRGADDVYARCEVATEGHAYVAAKSAAGVPLDDLRVVPAGDPLRIHGESMAGALVVPVCRADGTLSTLQFITTGDTATRLKGKIKTNKVNLPNCSVQGWYVVGELIPEAPVYVVEGIGQAWSCWQATGHAAVVSFGAGRMRTVATELRERDPTAHIVIVPDKGKEADAEAIARDLGAAVACMPEGTARNFDANDYAQREGADALALLLEQAHKPEPPAPRFKLLTAADLRNLPPLAWRVRGVLPAVGLAALYGPSTSGKSFLGFDMAAAIADGQRWFDCRVDAAPVVYAALEGEAGFALRAQAWEASRGRSLPAELHMMLQPFKLTEPQDVADLAAVVPAGAVVFIDTLNRAAPTADENSSKDMGEILEAAKRLQAMTGGLVVLVHHTGKDSTRGLRGHSSLFAAMDACIETMRDGDRRVWKVAKSKDGQDGDAHAFRLQVETLGTDEHGDTITSCVVMRDTTAQDVRAVKLPQGGNQRVILDALRPMFKDGTTGKTGAPPMRPCLELEAAVSAGAAKLTCQTDRRATRTREAITGLVARGVMGCNEGWLWLA